MDTKELRGLMEAYTSVYAPEEEIDEAREPGVKPYRPNPTQAEIRAGEKEARKKQVEKSKGQSGYGPEDKFKSDWKLRSTPSTTFKRKTGETETVSQRMDREKPYAKRMTGQLAREYGTRAAERVSRVRIGRGEPRAVKLTQTEQFDVYDIILSHLLDEGYATSVESAEAIMVNMSEQWIESILG